MPDTYGRQLAGRRWDRSTRDQARRWPDVEAVGLDRPGAPLILDQCAPTLAADERFRIVGAGSDRIGGHW